MAKRGRNQKSGNRNPKKMKANTNVGLEDMDDEVDVFHKQRDKIPLDMNDDSAESDDEQPVFDYKRTQKYLKAKHGNLEDDLLDDAEEDTEEQRAGWGRLKSMYHNADNIDFELQSDDGSAEEEEAEAIRLRKEIAKSMTMDDFGIEDDENDASDSEPTLEESMLKQKDTFKPSKKKDTEGSHGIVFEEVKKDLSSLSKDEQMDVVSSSAPELVGLLSELNDALTQLDQINPLVSKVKLQKDATKKEELHYLEVKKLLLLAYSQAITFYLLLKSEGQPVRDHPVISRLVEIKSLLDKIKVLDENLPFELELLLNEIEVDVATSSAGKDTTTVVERSSDSNDTKQPIAVEPNTQKLQTVETLQVNLKEQNKHKRPKEAVSSQSVQMLSVRAALEEKLKQKGVFTTLESNSQLAQKQKLQQHNSQLESFDDFGDDAVDVEGNLHNGHPPMLTNKISQLITTKGNKNKVSGDDDLPLRDDLGERRRKHELRVIAGAGVDATDDGDFEQDENEDESDDELSNLQEAKLATKNPKTLVIPSEPETVDGKRLITQQIEKNRGLTPHRKKLTKNPRKKYKLKHEKAKKRLGGQVRQVRKPQGPYGGESTGINAGVSRSISMSVLRRIVAATERNRKEKLQR
ncbi:hypothetical protein V2J09_007896 [Rumex salicifolius]